MARGKRLTKTDKAKQAIRREGKALFVGISIFAGTAAFLMILRGSWDKMPANWMWLAVTIALIILPRVFTKLKRSKEPYVIQFARAFREGFLSPCSIAPLSKKVGKVRDLLKTLLKKGGSPEASGEIIS